MPVVEIALPDGRLRGLSHGGVRRFLGVPYAAPIGGAGRFAAPHPVVPWHGIRDATVAGPTSPQPDRSRFGSLDVSPFFAPGWVRGDDHLTVNVWAPEDTDGRAPVLVFVHGGGFIAGSASAPAYDGTGFARDGVVFVGVNYRLGAPGFLAVPDAPDNRGVLDVIQALRWVRENIAAFGGDPAAVTLAGQSAGAVIIASVLCEPDAEGLAHRAIMQSGTGVGAFTPEQGEIVASAFAEQLGVDLTVDALGAVPDAALVGASVMLGEVDVATASARAPIGDIVRFGPVHPRQPADRIAESWGGGVELLIGTNLDEAGLYLAPTGQLDGAVDPVAAAARFVDEPESLVAAYRREFPDADDVELVRSITGDGMFGAGTRRFADRHQSAGGTTHVYEFTWRPDSVRQLLGASHLMELPFVFDTDAEGLRGPDSLLGTTPPPADLAVRMHAAWVDFIQGLGPGWPACTADAQQVQSIGERWEMHSGHRARLHEAWGSA
ncbi:para-nitrobenzyl esterase [Microbacterium sp. W4I4]|uniref:carboxylesterase/lipase family protein n=1 Tax=Microbacterium sp. W4I4 TaxID=3042295 RepID=UPI00278B1860|nr:carboxylesterase family protein [Microbacterium sp. W4I4]MDQ0614830.1 para-nitrobenzyl esterase [Microbacterium sp. W4I4]